MARLLKDPATVSSRIFVGHLQTEDLSKLQFEEHFSKYGTIVGSLINRGFGFIQFEDEQSALKAIQNENGVMLNGKRIDVRPAKKDGGNSGASAGSNTNATNNPGTNTNSIMNTPNKNQFGGPPPQFSSGNDSFNPGNQSFGGGNQSFDNSMNSSFGNDGNTQFGGNQQQGANVQNRQDSSFGDNQSHEGSNDQFANSNNPNRSGNQNRGGNANQNRPGGNQNRNQNQIGACGIGSGNNSNDQQTHKQHKRGNRGGRNKNKNRDNQAGNNFRDRSPLNRGGGGVGAGGINTGGPGVGGVGGGPGAGDKIGREWELNKQLDRSGNYGRPLNDIGRYDDYKGLPHKEPISNFGPNAQMDYSPMPVEKNDCEIIVVDKTLTEYAETIEMRLKRIGLTVDLLFPNEDVLLSRVLGNIASRGCLYAVVVTPINQEHRSLTLNILHGLPQEHRNMPVEDAVALIARDFANYRSGGRSVPLNTPFASDRHPDAIQVLLNMLADNHQLTVLQYDRVIKYLEIKREDQIQAELGDAKDLASTTFTSDPKQAELQSRILNILNSNKSSSGTLAAGPTPSPVPAPTPVPPTTWGTATATPSTTSTTTTGVSPSPLLNDPTVQKALDSLLQGNLLKSIGDQQQAPAPTAASTSAPLFAAFPNIGRF